MKRAMIFALIIAMFLLTGCSGQSNEKSARITTAKVRYFDGSCDTLEVDRWYSVQPGVVTIHTKEGRTVCIGVNNVILIEETIDQYEGRDFD